MMVLGTPVWMNEVRVATSLSSMEGPLAEGGESTKVMRQGPPDEDNAIGDRNSVVERPCTLGANTRVVLSVI